MSTLLFLLLPAVFLSGRCCQKNCDFERNKVTTPFFPQKIELRANSSKDPPPSDGPLTPVFSCSGAGEGDSGQDLEERDQFGNLFYAVAASRVRFLASNKKRLSKKPLRAENRLSKLHKSLFFSTLLIILPLSFYIETIIQI